MDGINFDLLGNNADLISKVEQTRAVIRTTLSELQKEEEETARVNEKLSFSFKKAWGAINGTEELKKFVGDVVKVRSEFQQLETSFSTLLQDKGKADALMSQVMKTAATTPFSVTELGAGAKQLLSYGLEAEEVNNTLIQLGNIASGLGLPLERLTSLYGTVMSQGSLYTDDLDQFTNSGIPMLQGLADMYGVTTGKVNEMVSAGQIGFPEVQRVIQDMTSESGQFYNQMDVQSGTIAGKINNLGDAWNMMLNSIGQSQDGVINASLDGAQYLIENYEQIGNILLSLIETYGVYRAACIAHMILTQSFATTQMQLGLVLAKLKTSFLALTATMNLNPWVLAVTAIIGLGVAMWNLADHTSAAERAQKKFNEGQDKFNQQQEERKQKIEKLIHTIQDETETEYTKIKAYEKLKKHSPALTAAYSLEELATLNLAKAKKVLNEEEDKIDYQNIIKQVNKYTEYVNRLSQNGDTLRNVKGMYSEIVEEYGLNTTWEDRLNLAKEDLEKWKNILDKYNRIKKEAEEKDIPIDRKITLAETDLNQIKEEYNKVNTLMLAERAKAAANPFYVIPLRLGLEYEGLDRKVQQAQAKVAALKNQKAQGTTYQQDLANSKTAWQNAKKGYQTLLRDPKATSKQVTDAKTTLTSAEKGYKDLGGVTDNNYEDRAKRLREQQKQLDELIARQAQEQIRSTEDLWNQVWQAQVDAINEGGEKTLAQMELNHEKELQAIDREKTELLQKKIDAAEAVFNQEEDIKLTKDPNYKKQTFNASGAVLSDTENQQYDEKYKTTLTRQARDRQAYYDSEKQAMNEYLTAYGTYAEKRQAIIDMAEAKKKGKNEWEQKTIDEETGKTLSDLGVEANKGTAAFSQLFSDMSKRTVKDLRTIADEAQKALKFVKAGKWNAEEGQKFGISEDTFTEMQKPSNKPGEVENIQNGINDVNKEADACETSLNKMGNGFKKVFAASSDTKKLKEGLAEIEEGMNGVMQAGQFLSNALSGIGDAFGNEAISGIAEGIGVAMDAVGGAMDGAKAGAAFGPWGAAAGAAIGLVSSLSSSLAKIHDAKNERRIQAMQDQVEALEKTYGSLGEAVEKAYSTDASKLISQQNTLLEQQKVLIQNQIAEEQSKKNADGGRIEEWQNQIDSINKQIGQNEEKKIDIVLGSDAKSAIDEFAQAYADAWAAGNDRAKSSKDLVKDMIKQMVMEAIKMTSSEPMKKLRDKLAGFFSDGIVSAWEREQIEKDAEAIMNDLDSKYGWADEYMKGDEESTSQADSSKGGFETMSQETGTELNGRFTALQISNEEIKNSMLLMLGNLSSLCTTTTDGNILLSEMRNLAVMSNGHLEDIAKHTKVLLGFGEKLDKIEKNTNGL